MKIDYQGNNEVINEIAFITFLQYKKKSSLRMI